MNTTSMITNRRTNDVAGSSESFIRNDSYMTRTIIRKWGNSQGIRLPKEIMSEMNLKQDDAIGINICDGKMIIEKINKPKFANLQERLEAFYERPIDEIFVENTDDIDVGGPVGNEIW